MTFPTDTLETRSALPVARPSCATPGCRNRPQYRDDLGSPVCGPCLRADRGQRTTDGEPAEVPPTPVSSPEPEPAMPAPNPTSAPSSVSDPPVAPGSGGGVSPVRARLVLAEDADAHPERCRIAGCQKPPKYRGLCAHDYSGAHRFGLLDALGLPVKVRGPSLLRQVTEGAVEPARDPGVVDTSGMVQLPPERVLRLGSGASSKPVTGFSIRGLEGKRDADAGPPTCAHILPDGGDAVERINENTGRCTLCGDDTFEMGDGDGGEDPRDARIAELERELARVTKREADLRDDVGAICDRREAPRYEGDDELPLSARVAWLGDEIGAAYRRAEGAEAQVRTLGEALTRIASRLDRFDAPDRDVHDRVEAALRYVVELEAEGSRLAVLCQGAHDTLDLASVAREGTPAERVHRLVAQAEAAIARVVDDRDQANRWLDNARAAARAEIDGMLSLRVRFGARGDETVEMWIERLYRAAVTLPQLDEVRETLGCEGGQPTLSAARALRLRVDGFRDGVARALGYTDGAGDTEDEELVEELGRRLDADDAGLRRVLLVAFGRDPDACSADVVQLVQHVLDERTRFAADLDLERRSNAGFRETISRSHDALDEAGVPKGGTPADRVRALALRALTTSPRAGARERVIFAALLEIVGALYLALPTEHAERAHAAALRGLRALGGVAT
jgi:hypothetical protein